MQGFLERQSSACWMTAVQADFYTSSAEESTRQVQCQNLKDMYQPIFYLCILLLKTSHWGYCSSLLSCSYSPTLVPLLQPCLPATKTRDFQIPKCIDCAEMLRTSASAKEIRFSLNGCWRRSTVLYHTEMHLSSLLAAHKFLFYSMLHH